MFSPGKEPETAKHFNMHVTIQLCLLVIKCFIEWFASGKVIKTSTLLYFFLLNVSTLAQTLSLWLNFLKVSQHFPDKRVYVLQGPLNNCVLLL